MGKCYYCGVKLRGKFFTVDHLTPSSRGGSDNIDNLTPCCLNCNSEKDNLTVEEYRCQLAIYKAGGPEFSFKQIKWLNFMKTPLIKEKFYYEISL